MVPYQSTRYSQSSRAASSPARRKPTSDRGSNSLVALFETSKMDTSHTHWRTSSISISNAIRENAAPLQTSYKKAHFKLEMAKPQTLRQTERHRALLQNQKWSSQGDLQHTRMMNYPLGYQKMQQTLTGAILHNTDQPTHVIVDCFISVDQSSKG